jgi:phospholipid/cholesterol/gamma-HCH transport system permease protein
MSQRRSLRRVATASGFHTVPLVTYDIRRIAGRMSLRALGHIGRVAYFCLELVRGMGEWRLWIPRAFEQAQAIGVGSLFIVLLTASFAGAVTALQAGYQLTEGVPVYFAGGVIVETIILELGPVLTALILAGRIGARYAAELGTMRVTEQIDALESLGRSAVSHLLLPRVVAAIAMLPVLTVLAIAIGIMAGWLAAKGPLGMSNADFEYGAQYFFKSFDVWYAVIKAFFFGMAVSIVPCYVGFNTAQGAEGVGKSTTGAVVSASVLILLLDAVLANVLLPG